MGLDYRQFGECQKTIASAGTFLTATATREASFNGNILPLDYKYIHAYVLADANVTFKLQHDLVPGASYTIDVAAGTELIGLSELTINTGTLEVFLFL